MSNIINVCHKVQICFKCSVTIDSATVAKSTLENRNVFEGHAQPTGQLSVPRE